MSQTRACWTSSCELRASSTPKLTCFGMFAGLSPRPGENHTVKVKLLKSSKRRPKIAHRIERIRNLTNQSAALCVIAVTVNLLSKSSPQLDISGNAFKNLAPVLHFGPIGLETQVRQPVSEWSGHGTKNNPKPQFDQGLDRHLLAGCARNWRSPFALANCEVVRIHSTRRLHRRMSWMPHLKEAEL